MPNGILFFFSTIYTTESRKTKKGNRGYRTSVSFLYWNSAFVICINPNACFVDEWEELMNINKNNGVLWYVLSLGMSMSYLPIKGIVLMIGSASLQGVIPVIIWQAVAAGFSIIALGNQKSKEDFTLSIVSLIFAIVLAVVVVLFECLQRS